MTQPPDEANAPPDPQLPVDNPRVIDTRELFRGDREIWIEHDEVRYRLRITRRNKLILQK